MLQSGNSHQVLGSIYERSRETVLLCRRLFDDMVGIIAKTRASGVPLQLLQRLWLSELIAYHLEEIAHVVVLEPITWRAAIPDALQLFDVGSIGEQFLQEALDHLSLLGGTQFQRTVDPVLLIACFEVAALPEAASEPLKFLGNLHLGLAITWAVH